MSDELHRESRYDFATAPRLMDRRVTRTIAFLERAGYRSYPTCSLAAMVNVSSSRLQHLFKANTGSSIREFVRKRRLARAAVLIRSTDLRISEIFWSVGFTDASNFVHAFKREFGVSPRRFRDENAPAIPAITAFTNR